MFDKLIVTDSEGAFILSLGAPYTTKRLMVVYDFPYSFYSPIFWKPSIVFSFFNETSFSVPIRARKIYVYIVLLFYRRMKQLAGRILVLMNLSQKNRLLQLYFTEQSTEEHRQQMYLNT